MNEKLIQTNIEKYLQLKKQFDDMKEELDMLKEEVKAELVQNEMNEFISLHGIARLSTFSQKRINNKLLTDYIGKDNLDKVKTESMTSRFEIISHDSNEKRGAAYKRMKENQEKQNEE